MSHNHNHDHGSEKNIKQAFLLNFAFTLLEIIGGIWTNSMAIISDALHDLGDSLSLGVTWYLVKFSKKGPDNKYSFGYARFSLLGSLVSTIILIIGSIIIIINSIPRIFNPEEINYKGMLLFAFIGVIVNGVAVLKLKKGKSINEKVALWHLLEDVLGWLVILIASIILIFIDIPILDPILSLMITLFVLYNVIKHLKEILSVFLQGVPKNLSIIDIEKDIKSKINVKSVHHTHIWTLEGEKIFLSTHVIVDDNTEYQEIIKIKQEIKELMSKKEINHVTIEIEFVSEKCQDKNCI